MFIKNEVFLELNERLGFNSTGNEQDWPIEFADPNQLPEFIHIVNVWSLSDAEKHAMVELIIASYDDLLNEGNVDSSVKLWSDVLVILKSDSELYQDILNRWALWGEDDVFAITPLIRDFLNKG